MWRKHVKAVKAVLEILTRIILIDIYIVKTISVIIQGNAGSQLNIHTKL